MSDNEYGRKRIIELYSEFAYKKNKLILDYGRVDMMRTNTSESIKKQIVLEIISFEKKLRDIEILCQKMPAYGLTNIKKDYEAMNIDMSIYGDKLINEIKNCASK